MKESEDPEAGSSLFNLFRIDKWRREINSKGDATHLNSMPASPAKCQSILLFPDKPHLMKNKDFFKVRRNTMDIRYRKSPTVDHSKGGRLQRKSMGHGWFKNPNSDQD